METTRPVDLWAGIAWTVLTVGWALSGAQGLLRVVLGVVFVVVLPGYTLLAVLFPERHRTVVLDGNEDPHEEGLAPFERGVVSLGLSLAAVAALLLGLNFSPWPLSQASVVLTLGAFNLVASLEGFRQRSALDPEDRLRFRWPGMDPVRSGSALGTVLNVVLVLSVLTAAGTLFYAMANPNPGEPFTEFYVLGPDGNATFPENVTTGEPLNLTVGIGNHEHRAATYEVTMLSQTGKWSGADGNRSFQVEDEQRLDTWTVQLENGERRAEERSLTFSDPGPRRILLHLSLEGADEEPYRDLRVYVNATEEESTVPAG